jgi:hypothetical protein
MPRWIEQIVDYGGSPRTVRGIAGLLLLLMLALGVLQYVWIGQLSDAKRSEMQQALRTSTWRFTSEFHRDLARIYANLLVNRPFTEAESMERHAERFRQWSAVAMHPKLVKRVLIIDRDDLFILDNENNEFERAQWTPELKAVDRLEGRGRLRQCELLVKGKGWAAADFVLLVAGSPS